jgi:hypothetical protein
MTHSRRFLALPLLAAPLIAAFGGWATITVENLPEYVVANQPTNITFSVRQHGVRLMSEVRPTIDARSGKTEMTARAVQTNRPGYYTATVTAPFTGPLYITIHSGWGKSDVTLRPIAAIAANSRPVAISDFDRGHNLFVAKGCASCHVHSRVDDSGSVNVGPDLTAYRLQRDYLEKFLANPSVKTAWRSDARMPNLNLKSGEISALISFLNDEKHGVAASN